MHSITIANTAVQRINCNRLFCLSFTKHITDIYRRDLTSVLQINTMAAFSRCQDNMLSA